MLPASMLRDGLNVVGTLTEFRGTAVADEAVTGGCRCSGRELSTDPAGSVQESRGFGNHLPGLCSGCIKGEGYRFEVIRLHALATL